MSQLKLRLSNEFRGLPWAVPAPLFVAPTSFNPAYQFSSLGGHFILLVFIGNMQIEGMQKVLTKLLELKNKFQENKIVAFAVTSSPNDLTNESLLDVFPYKRIFLDSEWSLAKEYRALKSKESGELGFCPSWTLIDPMLRVYDSGRLTDVNRLVSVLKSLPESEKHTGVESEPWAPVLLIPRVLPVSFCKTLIDIYNSGNPDESGFMRQENGRTVGKLDPSFKRRKDVTIKDAGICAQFNQMILMRVVPEIKKAFQFDATCIERHIVACYSASDSGFFKRHRDNTTQGTAHRRFAVTINLNAEDYTGGELTFPEFGSKLYKAPTGGAVVFSCSLLHEATPVTSGLRYATLPFLYGTEDSKLKRQNSQFIDGIKKSPDTNTAESVA